VYERLKAAALANRRSLNSEAIVCLETMLMPERVSPAERVKRVRELRCALPQAAYHAEDIDTLKRERRS
jgi:hypothetical protein